MPSGDSDSKRLLRDHLKAVVETLSAATRESSAAKACALLVQQPAWTNAGSILFYAPLPSEINIWPLVSKALAGGKIVLLPRFNVRERDYEACQINNLKRDLTPGKFGIWEPAPGCAWFPLNRLDLTLVPGIAFNAIGGRLGRGRGFYDRLLVQVSGIKCGVAFDEQVVPEIPTEPHDIRLNCILTPTRWLTVGQ
jgi:5-formyltetrahydrofolate cyclo-ligase